MGKGVLTSVQAQMLDEIEASGVSWQEYRNLREINLQSPRLAQGLYQVTEILKCWRRSGWNPELRLRCLYL